jgi:heat shock protein HspQ
MAEETKARFRVGQIVQHKLFDYRGVVIDVDPVFSSTEEWYEVVARSRPPKDEPWYHVLVHNASHMTYVAERNLEVDESAQPVDHHLVDEIFSGIENGVYVVRQSVN